MRDVATTAWDRTIAGKPAVGAVAERSRTTATPDVEAVTAMTGGTATTCTMPLKA